LALDENLQLLDEDEIEQMLGSILMKFYNQKLRQIVSDTTMPFNQKSFLIRKIKTDIIPQLQRGKLGPFSL